MTGEGADDEQDLRTRPHTDYNVNTWYECCKMPIKREGKIVAFRMDESTYETLTELAQDMGITRSHAVTRCIKAVLEMLNNEEPIEPAMIRAVRTMRANGTTFASKPRKLRVSTSTARRLLDKLTNEKG